MRYQMDNFKKLLTEISNPYKVEWVSPDKSYMTQELSELLGNEVRFTEQEFFNPANYDTVYKIMPKTFKTIAEFAKGSEVESEKEIKNILLNQNMQKLLKKEERWNELKNILMNDSQCVQEGYKFFGLGQLKVWKGNDPETGKYVDNINDTEYLGKLTTFVKPLKPTVSSKMSQHLKDVASKEPSPWLGAYAGNIDQYREYAKQKKERVLPAPFVVKYNTKKFGKEYVLIGGHKRSATALELGVEPMKVWLIDLTK